MKSTLAVAKWEFVGTIKNRQFILFTTLFPLIFLGFGFLSILLAEPELGGALKAVDPEMLRQQLEAATGVEPAQAISSVVAVVFAFIFLFVVLFSGTFVLQNIVREKQSRVVELLLAAISPRELLYGKILAFGALGLVQAAIWVAVGVLALLVVGPYLGVPTWPLFALILSYLPWDKLMLFAIYFALGYLFIASFSAGMGATMTDILSGQQLQSLLIALPAALPLLIFSLILAEPQGFLPRLFSFLPPTIPGTMMLRLAVAPIPIWEIALSLVVLLGAIIVVMHLAGKVFEIGILMYGKSASLREIWRWARR
jgi:ABC-2 type transport system permease protein